MTSTHKNAKVKLDLLTDIYMLLIVEKGIKGEMCNSVYQYSKANNKYMKYYDKKRILIYSILGCNNLHGWAMSQKLLVNNFEWTED